MFKAIISSFLLVFYVSMLSAQVAPTSNSFPDRSAAVEDDQVARVSAIESFKDDFTLQPSGILHVYVDPTFDPAEVYLFQGREASGTTKALLPRKFQRLAKRLGATIYATKAINLYGTENLYVVRLDGIYEDRIELFAINGYDVEHVRTLAYLSCLDGKCTQKDTWITDIDGNSNADLIEISRVVRNGKNTTEREAVYMLTEKGKWKKSKQLKADAPWSTIEFFKN